MENTDFGSKILIWNPQNTDLEFISRLACLPKEKKKTGVTFTLLYLPFHFKI